MAYEIVSEQITEALNTATEEVLETMFFSTVSLVTDPLDKAALAGMIAARVQFRGNPPGIFTLALSASSAQLIAENFLGAEPGQLNPTQVSEVVLELANMICGSVLSRVETNTLFELSAPELVPAAENLPEASQTFDVDGSGHLAVDLRIES